MCLLLPELSTCKYSFDVTLNVTVVYGFGFVNSSGSMLLKSSLRYFIALSLAKDNVVVGYIPNEVFLLLLVVGDV